jgi:hypothetical protein
VNISVSRVCFLMPCINPNMSLKTKICGIAGGWTNSGAFKCLIDNDMSFGEDFAALCYDTSGKMWEIEKNSPDEEIKKFSEKVAIIMLKTTVDCPITYVLRNNSYIDLMHKIHTGLTCGKESSIRYYTADRPFPLVFRVPAKPESLRCALVTWCRSGGIAAGSSALCALFGVLAAGFFGMSPITLAGVGVPLLVVLFGLAFSGVMHLVYRRVTNPTDYA